LVTCLPTQQKSLLLSLVSRFLSHARVAARLESGEEKDFHLGRPQLSRTMKIFASIKALLISVSLSIRLAHGDDFDDAILGFMDAQYILGTSVAFHEVRTVQLAKLFLSLVRF